MSNRNTRLAVLVAAIAAAILVWWSLRSPEPAPGSAAQAANDDGKASPAARGLLDGKVAAKDPFAAMPWRRPGALVSGIVRSEEGAMLAGASVCLWSHHDLAPSALSIEPKCTTSGADGRYQLEDVPPVRAEIHATLRGYLPAQYRDADDQARIHLQPGAEHKGVDFTLEPGGVEIKGVVKDISGGVIEGALLSVRGERNMFSFGDRARSIARSDADGNFTAWAAEGRASVTANAEGYSDSSRSGVAPGFTFELFLTPESVLSGRVVLAGTDTPVPHAVVSAYGGRFRGRGEQVLTDDDGRFRIERLEPGTYHPSVTGEGLFGKSDVSVQVGLAESADDIVIEAHALAYLQGVIVLAGTKGEPCARGGRVQLTGKDGNSNSYWGSAEPDGGVKIRAIQPGTYAVSASCDERVERVDFDDLVIGTEPITGQTWELAEGLRLTGRVLDPDGQPIVGASVSARSVRQARGSGQTYSAWERSAKDGTFTLDGLGAGTYNLDADAPGFLDRPDPIEIELGETGAPATDISLERGGTIRGTVADQRGEPVPGASVRVTNSRWSAQASTADDGSFELEGAKPGDHRVVANKGWRDELRAPGSTDDSIPGTPVTVVAGEVVEVDLVVETQDGTISGRVVDADGGPVADAFIDHSRESDSAAAAAGRSRQSVRWGSWGRQAILTDTDGAFTLDELADGNYTIRAYRKGGGEAIIEGIAVGSTSVQLQIAETGSIGGVVVFTGGGAPDNFSVTLNDKIQGTWRSDTFFKTEGKFTISELPPGTYEVAVTADAGDATDTATLEIGADVTDLRIELTPRVNVTGRVLDLETKEPVPGMKVSIGARKGGFSFNFGNEKGDEPEITDDRGHFAVNDAAAGRVRIMVMPRDFADETYGWTTLNGEVPTDVDTHDIGDIFVVPSRRKRSDDDSDLGFKIKERPPEEEDDDDFPLEVAFVRPGGPAAEAGLVVGDIIESVDGHDVTGTNRYRYRSLSSVVPTTAVKFGLAGGRSVTIVAAKGTGG
jgi:protocatechuate 3,4-dioxygenase beta subunit